MRRVVELLGPRLVVSPSHEAVLPDVPPENLLAMARAVWGVRDGIAVEGTWDKAVFDLCLPVGVGIGVYALAHWILRSPELSRLRPRR